MKENLKPDEGRLPTGLLIKGGFDPIIESLIAKTASTIRAECQERVEGVFKEVEKESCVEKHCPWGKGVYIDVRFIEEGKWQFLKKKEGVK